MGILDTLSKNFFSKNVVGGRAEVTPVEDTRLPVAPAWFSAARFGQPRNINILETRSFAKSSWVQMIKTTIKKEIMTIDWDVVNKDSEDETDYESQIQLVKDFFNRINSDSDDWIDLCIFVLDDVCDIDAGAHVKVYELDSYTVGQVPYFDIRGNVAGYFDGLVLKPFGQRRLKEVRFADGSTMLRQTDIYRRTLAWYQYSFINPKNAPMMFYPDEVIYYMMNKRTESIYGFSPVQASAQIIELLTQATRWNKDYFKNNGIPDGIIGLPNANDDSMKKFKEMWNLEFKGKPHKLLFHNTAAQFTQFMNNSRDMEWLDGQKWYFHMVFGQFGMSPTEAGFHENVNQGNQAGQERITVKNAIKPYLKLFEKGADNIIRELLQEDKPKICFKFLPKDHAQEQIEFDQAMQEIDRNALTINEYRRSKGLEPVDWGDEQKQNFNPQPNDSSNTPANDDAKSQREAEAVPKKKLDFSDIDSISKSVDVDTVVEAKDYEEFFTKTVDKWKEKILNALPKLESEKMYNADLLDKTFGQFLRDLMNAINTKGFLTQLAGFIKSGLMEGKDATTEEIGVNVSWSEPFDQKVLSLQHQQLDGYTVNGERWFGIKGATKDLQMNILNTVSEDVRNKATTEIMSKHIVEIFDGATMSQAKRIARTETTRFVNEGKLTAYKTSGIKGLKSWDVVPRKCCELCDRLHDKYVEGIPFDKEFVDEQSGWHGLNPAAHPNCKCVISYKPLI